MKEKIIDALETLGLVVETVKTEGATYEFGSEVRDIPVFVIRAYEKKEAGQCRRRLEMKGLEIKLYTEQPVGGSGGGDLIFLVKAGDIALRSADTLEDAVRFVKLVDAAYGVTSGE